MVTIKEIAEMAGVHRSTVDKVLHNRPGVSDDVRTRIKRLIDELGYESNPLGKALNYQRRKFVIVAVLLEVDALAEIRAGLEAAYEEYRSFNIELRYEIVKYPDYRDQARRLRQMAADGVSGVIVTPLTHEKLRQAIDELSGQGIPVVTVNVDVPKSGRCCYIGQDMQQAGAVAARLFGLLMSHKGQAAIITSSTERELSMVADREIGFRQYLDSHEVAVDIKAVIETNEEPVSTLLKTAELLRREPELSGIFITCGCVQEVCQAVRAAGKSHLVIVCFERYPAIEALLREGTVDCTISSDLKAQGYQSLKVLFEYCLYDRLPAQETFHMDIGIFFKENI